MTYQSFGIAPLRNVAALMTLTNSLIEQSPLLPKMGCYYGPAGDGKTSAATYASNHFNAVRVECRSTWNRSDVCKTVLRELGIKPKGTINQMCEALSEQLLVQDRPLIVDEADLIVKKNQGEIFRDIYEMSQVPVILIGEEKFPQMIQAAGERLHGRMAQWVHTEPVEMRDFEALCKIYSPGIEIREDLLEKLLKESRSSMRRVCVNLQNLDVFARRQGLSAVTLADWGSRSFFTGQAPLPRPEANTRARVAS